MTHDLPRRRRRRILAVAAPAVAAAALAGAAAPAPADAQCILTATYLGAAYVGHGTVPADEIAGRAGRGSIPGCDDVVVVPPLPPEPSRTVTVRRLRGIAPRFAVAQGENLLVAASSPCVAGTPASDLACLRRLTTRLITGPSLVAPPSARPGAVVRLAVHVQDAARRKEVTYGLDALLQARVEGRWTSLFHLVAAIGGGDPPAAVAVGGPGVAIPAIGVIGGAPQPVRLPQVTPGAYRIAKRVSLGARSRWLFSDLTITAP